MKRIIFAAVAALMIISTSAFADQNRTYTSAKWITKIKVNKNDPIEMCKKKIADAHSYNNNRDKDFNLTVLENKKNEIIANCSCDKCKKEKTKKKK